MAKLNTYRLVDSMPAIVELVGLIPGVGTAFETVRVSRTTLEEFILSLVPTVQGEPGIPVELQASPTHIQWRYVGASIWIDIVSLESLKGTTGDPGPSIQLRSDGTYIQFSYDGETWTNLIPLTDLKGLQGNPGPGVPAGGAAGYVLSKSSVADYDAAWIPNQKLNSFGVQKMSFGVIDMGNPVTIASALTININTAQSEIVFISGNEWIGGLGTTVLGARRTLIFNDGASLAHSTAIQIPGEINFTARPGDVVEVVGTVAGSWKVVNIRRYASNYQSFRLTADVTSSVVTLGTLTGLVAPVLSNSQYLFEAMVSFTTAAATTGLNLGWSGPVDCDCLGEIVVPIVNTAGATALRGSFQASNANVLGTGTTAGGTHVASVRGILSTFTAGEFKLMFASEVASSLATIKAGSILNLTKIG